MDQLPENVLEKIFENLSTDKELLNLACKSWRSIYIKIQMKHVNDLKMVMKHQPLFSLVSSLDVQMTEGMANMIFPKLKLLKLNFYAVGDFNPGFKFLANHLFVERLALVNGGLSIKVFEKVAERIIKVLPGMKQLLNFHLTYVWKCFDSLIESLANHPIKHLELASTEDVFYALKFLSFSLTHLETLKFACRCSYQTKPPSSISHLFPHLRLFHLSAFFTEPECEIPLLSSVSFPSLISFASRLYFFSRSVYDCTALCFDMTYPNQWPNLTIKINSLNPDMIEKLTLLGCKHELDFVLDSSNSLHLICSAINSLSQITTLKIRATNWEDSLELNSKNFGRGFKHMPHLKELDLVGNWNDDIFSDEFTHNLTKLSLIFSHSTKAKDYTYANYFILFDCPKLEFLKFNRKLLFHSEADLREVNLKNLKSLDNSSFGYNEERLVEFIAQLPSLIRAYFYPRVNLRLSEYYPQLYLKPFLCSARHPDPLVEAIDFRPEPTLIDIGPDPIL